MPLLDPRLIDRRIGAPIPHTVETAQQQLLRRAELLLPPDRLLVQLALRNHLSRRQLAEVMGIPAGSVSRRLQRLGARLNDPLVIALLHEKCTLAADYRQLGVEYFLQDRPMRDLARSHDMPLTEVRQIITYLRGWHRGATGRG
jgi:hypothetical protein